MMCCEGVRAFRADKTELAVYGAAIVLNTVLTLGEHGSSLGFGVLAGSCS